MSSPRGSSPRQQGGPSSHNQGGADVDEMADQLSEIARRLQAADDISAMLAELVAAAVEVIPGAQEASLSVVTARSHIKSQHPTGELCEKVDALQNELGEGPCLSAVWEHATVRVPNMAQELRWPRFAARASGLGVGSMLSFQLFVSDNTLGGLNLYSADAEAFDDDSKQIGLLFASHAAVAFADAQKLDDAMTAVASRDVIGQAKGILMERYGVDEDRAFTVLVRYSQATHRKLRDVAAELARRRRLPTLERDPRSEPDQAAAAPSSRGGS